MGESQPVSGEELRERLEALEQKARSFATRLDALEASLAARPAAVEGQPPELTQQIVEPSALGPGALESARGIVALGGRTVLALAGAYLIRALTDAGMLSPLAGVALGLAYALAWFVMAERAGGRGQSVSASFHGLAGALIGYPLLWETSTRLGLVPPAMALIALIGVFVAGTVVAVRNRLAFVAWVGTLLALGTSAGLLIATHALLEAVLALLVLAALLEALAFRGLWEGLRWPAALALDAAVLILAWLAGRPQGLPEGYPPVSSAAAVAAALAVPMLYVASIGARTLRLDRSVCTFEVLQGATALALGFGGAARLVAAHGGSGFGLGIAALVLGVACYAVAFAFVERRAGPVTNFYFYSSAGGLLTLLGSRAALGDGRALFWCVLAIGGSLLGRRFDRTTLRYHGAAYLWAAGLATGLLPSASKALLGDPRDGLPLPTVAGFLTAAAALACGAVLAWDRKAQGWRRIPHGLVAALTTWVVAGILVGALTRAGQATVQAPLVATWRTTVLAALAVALAQLARRFALAEPARLVYPILALGGLKLVLEDVPAGRAATLFASFVVYGAALLVAPRLLRARG